LRGSSKSFSDIPPAKAQKNAKFGKLFYLFSLRLGAFAGDIPSFGYGSAALGLGGESPVF
jgi:hypothetical protein